MNFPLLSTGAVAQYPLIVTTGQSSQVIRFLDGTDQRYRMQGRMLRQWEIRLELLSESEIQALESFFAAQLGGYSTFVFPDPYSGANVPNCRFAEDAFVSGYEAADISRASFWVIETNG
ncbi:MAG: DUF2460 domain-containing protein [Acidobacteriaceae bacterium]|nr:DUF2460 domain-containing protein [Acidobacteriaceae bacterium]